MSILPGRRRDETNVAPMPMPKAANVPAPAPLPASARKLREDAIKFGDHILGLEEQVRSLQAESDEWQRRALDWEREAKRLEARLNAMEREMDQRTTELIAARDQYRLEITELESTVSVQGKFVIEIAEVASRTMLETLDRLKKKKGNAEPVKVDMDELALELETPRDDPMPNVVLQGPRPPETTS